MKVHTRIAAGISTEVVTTVGTFLDVRKTPWGIEISGYIGELDAVTVTLDQEEWWSLIRAAAGHFGD